MTGILIVSHHRLAESVKETAELVVGKKENVAALALMKEDKAEDFSRRIKEAAEKLDTGDGVLILADMFGGTPCNVSLMLFGNNENIGIIAGFNLPLVLEAMLYSREDGLKKLTEKLMAKKDTSIIDVKAVYNSRR
ncbi:MAG TPA: PTS sugar transporter subunit IIA [bacterium]|nr:PTS sugar transporter subunit IIA [bacterium]